MATKLKTVEDALNDLPNPARNIAQRLNAVMAEVDYVQKNPKKEGMQYSYVSHDSVTKLVRPFLQTHGVVYYPRELKVSQSGNRTEAVFVVRFENIDDRTDYIDVATFGYGVDGQDKGPGKALSYGVKYALLKALGLETGDEPEAIQDERADYKPDARPGCINDSQQRILQTYIDGGIIDKRRFCAFFQIEELKDLPASRYDEALAKAQTKASQARKEPVNA